ncbi:MAG: DNA cytosine methyltransferase [Candidatus Gracilibacteria bacterium]|nr:DNA cytosine methyltransferase [Candidatus Gracilibacteria bacterium]
MSKKINLFEAFSGIGSQHRALENIGFEVNSVGISDWYISAIIAYGVEYLNIKPIVPEFKNKAQEKKYKDELKCKLLKYSLSNDSKKPAKNLSLGLEELSILEQVIDKFGKLDIRHIEGKDLIDKEIDLFTYSFPCFKEGTLVLTKKGYKDIKDIEVGEEVLTHTNKYQKVIKKFVTENKKGIYKLKIQGSLETFVTEEHPYYVREMEKKYSKITQKIERTFSKPLWKNVKDLKTGDFIGFNIQDNFSKTDKELKFYRFIGRLLADGWWGKYSCGPNTDRVSNRIVLCCNKNNGEDKDIEELLNGLYNYSKVEERTTYKFHIVNKELLEYLEDFGKYSHGKFVATHIFGLPKKYLEQFLLGYIDGDGTDKGGFFRVSSVSKKLILGMQQIVHKVYQTPTSIYYTKRKTTTIIEGRICNQRDTYELDIKKEKRKQDNGIKIDGYIWMPLKKKEFLDEINTVYNLEVENDNSYTANNCIVHNCQDISQQGKRAGFSKDSEKQSRSGLLWEIERILQEIKSLDKTKLPKVLMMENVKAILNKEFKPDLDGWIEELKNLGYESTEPFIVNSSDVGSPQNRSRVFMVSKLKENKNNPSPFGYSLGKREIEEFPEQKVETKSVLLDILQEDKNREILDESKYSGFIETIPKSEKTVKKATLEGYTTF